MPILDNVRDLAVGFSVWHTHTKQIDAKRGNNNTNKIYKACNRFDSFNNNNRHGKNAGVVALLPYGKRFADVGDCYIPLKISNVGGN